MALLHANKYILRSILISYFIWNFAFYKTQWQTDLCNKRIDRIKKLPSE